MASPTGDTAAVRLTARDLDSWDSDIFGSPAHPLIGPTGAPGYWDRASIAAAPTSPDSLRNCTFVTINPKHDATVYYGPTCPPAPRNPFADPEFWFGLLAPFIIFGLFMTGIMISTKLMEEPEVTWGEWAWRAWRASSKWVRKRVGALWARVARKLSAARDSTGGGGESTRTCLGGQVRWIAAPAIDASAVTESEGPNEQRSQVQWWRWAAWNQNGSGYMLVDTARSEAGGTAPAALAPPKDEELDVDGAPPPYNTEARSSRFS
ncbi:hypothetical protein AMAG_15893 [Allomyces macrogynus ATCC 38327]|uniref:Uncharacterized protein n=1 Tax=Allomyces macrogynus (strain ATCC 38327) TaxID=578462 RepID=A0A0L0T8U7_ALLM3|nr:hypothetical protein AMAG_15893 [Allomyces macrogynus ATCC 38327]|eukprot:KNE71238.1 hypothetical protein AMAG_15893 [Allomyces macrogynus ATCC 38327]